MSTQDNSLPNPEIRGTSGMGNWMQGNSLPDPEQVLKNMMAAGDIDFGVIKDGLCDTPEHQADFDKQQRDQAPLTA